MAIRLLTDVSSWWNTETLAQDKSAVVKIFTFGEWNDILLGRNVLVDRKYTSFEKYGENSNYVDWGID